ncbi:MAG: Ig-like domain-containing protein [Puniceicoccales bacterium]|nr:Ig-like domain-containing protein [Puniceicoccales bacterium]
MRLLKFPKFAMLLAAAAVALSPCAGSALSAGKLAAAPAGQPAAGGQQTPQPKPAAVLKLAAPFESHMVLQRDIAAPVWGVADPGATVTVAFDGQTKTATAGADGKWSIKLDPLRASSEGREFTVSATGGANGNAAVTLEDVLVGEVWVCSGQSNMEQGIVFKGTNNGPAEAAAANHPLLRIKYSKKVHSYKPRTDWQGGPWQVCSPATIKQGTWGGFSAAAYFFGRELQTELKVPVGLLQVAWGGTRIEPWTTPDGLASVPALAGAKGQWSGLYNAMVNPLVPFAIRGAIWYQGESNLGETDYADKTRALVQGWRKAWGQGDFPFYWVQLAPYNYARNFYNPFKGGQNPSERLPISWEQQTKALAIRNTGMAIINDVGNLRDIHPGDKKTVGKRLAHLALGDIYYVRYGVRTIAGKPLNDSSGPLFLAASLVSTIDKQNQKIHVLFKHANSGLKTRDGKAPSHFEVAGDDGIFHPATVKILPVKTKDGRKPHIGAVELTCPALTSLKAARFAWHELAEPNLINGDGLPAGAFRWEAKKDEKGEAKKEK